MKFQNIPILLVLNLNDEIDTDVEFHTLMGNFENMVEHTIRSNKCFVWPFGNIDMSNKTTERTISNGLIYELLYDDSIIKKPADMLLRQLIFKTITKKLSHVNLYVDMFKIKYVKNGNVLLVRDDYSIIYDTNGLDY